MKYSIDGGATYLVAPEGVHIIQEDVLIPGGDEDVGELHINHTDEGVIMDVWSRKNGVDHHHRTSNQMYDVVMHGMGKA